MFWCSASYAAFVLGGSHHLEVQIMDNKIWGYLRIFEDYPRIIRQSLNNGLSQPSLLAGVAAKPSRVTSCKEELNRHQLSLGQHGVQRERSEVWFIPISVFQPASLGPNPWWAMYKEKFCWAPTVRPTCWAVTVIRCRDSQGPEMGSKMLIKFEIEFFLIFIIYIFLLEFLGAP